MIKAHPRVPMTIDVELGPAMQVLNERQRRFVVNYCADPNGAKAYANAGYGANSDQANATCAHRLLASPRIKAAIIEHTQHTLTAMLPRTREIVQEIAETGDNNEKLKAIGMIWGRGGLHEVVEKQHTIKLDKSEQIRQIKELCATLGLDAKTMLGRVVDAEYSVVDDPDFAGQETRPALVQHQNHEWIEEADEEEVDPFGGLLGP